MRREVHTPNPVGIKQALRPVWPGQKPSPQRQHGLPQSSLPLPGYSYPDGHRIALYECLSTETPAEAYGTPNNRNYRQHSKLHKAMTAPTTPNTRHERARNVQINRSRRMALWPSSRTVNQIRFAAVLDTDTRVGITARISQNRTDQNVVPTVAVYIARSAQTE